MKWSKPFPLIVTLAAAAVILVVGYLGIVQGGKLLLKNESMPELVEYSNTSSNIFYGKIEDDIELFPWNYFPEGQQTAGEPDADPDGVESEQIAGEEKTPAYPQSDKWYRNEVKQDEESLFRKMIAYGCGEDERAVNAWYEQKGAGITESMVYQPETSFGNLFFYQDVLELQGRRYQIKLACNDWSILNFSWFPYREQEMQDSPQWKEGRDRITEIMKEIPSWMQELSLFLEGWYEQNLLGSSMAVNGDGDSVWKDIAEGYAERFFLNMEYLNRMLDAESGQEREEAYKNWKEYYLQEYETYGVTEKELENYFRTKSKEYSCQVVEVNDMILILLQGGRDIGLFYDPVDRKVCGFNYF